jgi:hypothetical protein
VARFDGRQVAALDWVGVVAGALALLDSFLSWRHVAGPNVEELARTLGLKTWYTAWGSGVTAWLPVVLLAGAAALLLAPGLGLRIRAVPLLWLVMSAAALVLIVVRWSTLPTPDVALLRARNLRPEDVDAGASIGLYLGLVIAAISVLGAVLRVLATSKRVSQETPTVPPDPSGRPSVNG